MISSALAWLATALIPQAGLDTPGQAIVFEGRVVEPGRWSRSPSRPGRRPSRAS